MNAVTATAPGKVVICGEYAVLDGATAIAAAVDRRAVVRAIDAPEPPVGHAVLHLVVEAFGDPNEDPVAL